MVLRKILCLTGLVMVSLMGFGVFAPSVSASDSTPKALKIYTHGQGFWAKQMPDGSFTGRGVDLLRCSMQALGQPYSLNVAAMVRKDHLAHEGKMDAWLPSLLYGPEKRRARTAHPIGDMPIYWYVPAETALDPASKNFKKQAKVSAFPGSSPARILRSEGYNMLAGSDDENTVVLWLINGKLDGFLSADFEALLKPRTHKLLVSKIKRSLYKTFEVGVEFSDIFMDQRPDFLPRFQKALAGCQ